MMPGFTYNATYERLWKAAAHLGLDGDEVCRHVSLLVGTGKMPMARAREMVVFQMLRDASLLTQALKSDLCNDSCWKRLAGEYDDARIAEEAR